MTYLWQTTLTVGEYSGWQGYADASVAEGNPAGSLGSASFDWDGTTYHVQRLMDSGDSDQMGIEFTTDLPSDTTGIVLRVGDLDLSFDEAPIKTDTFVQWTPDIMWTIGSVLNVKLCGSSKAAPPLQVPRTPEGPIHGQMKEGHPNAGDDGGDYYERIRADNVVASAVSETQKRSHTRMSGRGRGPRPGRGLAQPMTSQRSWPYVADKLHQPVCGIRGNNAKTGIGKALHHKLVKDEA